MTLYFYDTEFIEDGNTIELISIGIVASDGRTYYAVNSDLHMPRLLARDWLVRHVLPHLPTVDPTAVQTYLRHPANTYPRPSLTHTALDLTVTEVKPRRVIANEVRDFLLQPGRAGDPPVELWADYGAYDHVALCQLWGSMIQLPDGIPMWTHDLQQLVEQFWADPVEIDQLPQPDGHRPHHALDDAWATQRAYEHLLTLRPKRRRGGAEDVHGA